MTSKRSREAAYADLVAGLLDARTDPATDRFDAELAAAEDDGRVDAQTAKVLRWWQRESLRALVEHARVVMPPTLLSLEQAAAGADRETEASARSWARATGDQSVLGEPAEPPAAAEPAGSAAPADTSEPASTGGATEAAEASGDSGTDEAAAQATGTDDTLPPPADLSEHRRRLLVAGLTRVIDRP